VIQKHSSFPPRRLLKMLRLPHCTSEPERHSR